MCITAMTLLLVTGCGALKNSAGSGGGSATDGSASGRFGADSSDILGVQGVSWKSPTYGNPTVSGMVRSVVVQESPDQTLWWQHCFNNNTNCANNNPNSVRNVISNDPTILHGIQLNINRDPTAYSAVNMRMSVRTAELQFSNKTGEARLFNSSTQTFNSGLEGTCQPGAANAASFWPSSGEAAVVTGIYILEEYTAAPLDSQGKPYYTGAHATGARVWSRGVVPTETVFTANYVPYSNADEVRFGALGDGFKTSSDANILVTTPLGASGGTRVITGICIEGTKTYKGSGKKRPVVLGLKVRAYIPSIDRQ